jgi:hypothetical protein
VVKLVRARCVSPHKANNVADFSRILLHICTCAEEGNRPGQPTASTIARIPEARRTTFFA